MMDIEREIKEIAPDFAREMRQAADESQNEAEFRSRVYRLIEDFASQVNLPLHPREEYTLVNGRADAVYNRLIIEYESPGSLRPDNDYRANQHAIGQVKNYAQGIVRKERHKPERLAGAILDGHYFIFVRFKAKLPHIDDPVAVDDYSTEHFLKLLASLSTELALIPENLVRDFGENRPVSRKVVNGLYAALAASTNPKVKTLFEQWSLQFSEVCDYDKASKLEVESFARKFGVTTGKVLPFNFFFCLHTYYATLIKLLAVQVAHYYAMPRLGTDLKKATTFGSNELKSYLQKMEIGGIFRELGITNFLEGDFFGWYLDVWDDDIYESLKAVICSLAGYSLVTLDVDPDTTRDLLKKLYQQLMPRELRHNLGEYYTPDWLAERLLNMLDGGKFMGDPDKRLLDPACGSGTFLVIAIKRIRQYASERMLPESQVLDKVLANVVGFDLNPLAVISARTNYLLALGNLLQFRTGNIDIPVYLCDSIVTPQQGEDLFEKNIVKFNTAVGPFSVPKSLVRSRYIDTLSNFLEEAVRLNLNQEQLIERLCERLPLNLEQDDKDIAVVCRLYEKLQNLERQGVNSIWARIIKNAFAPLFVEPFDYVAGNPPWVNWEHLPGQYRKHMKPLWLSYGLFPHGGMDTILGKGKKDISMIMTYVAMDKYLKRTGKLGFLITQSVFKTSGAGQGFRKFRLGEKGAPLQVLHVDDMVRLNPFEGASNRTSLVIIRKGNPTKYPMSSYLYWRKTVKGKSIPLEATLDEVLEMTARSQFVAEPVDKNDLTSPWMTGRPRALRAVRRIIGKSDYVAHEGVNSGGANAVYWVDIVAERPDGLALVSNITKGAKRKVDSTQAAIELDILYPLLRGRDVKRWRAEPSAHIIMAQDPVRRRGIQEDEMKGRYPKTYLYLKRFEDLLRQRSAFKRYFTRKDKSGRTVETGPFYSMFNVGDYTFAPYKVVWTRVATDIGAAFVSSYEHTSMQKIIVPIETATMVSFRDAKEAHYFCSLLNSSPCRFAVVSYSVESTGGFGSPHILKRVCIPKFDLQNELHLHLAVLSEKAHEFAKIDDKENVKKVEKQIDEISAQIWGLTDQESKEIRSSLKELKA